MKIIPENFQYIINKVKETSKQMNVKVYAVGGFVRDLILERDSKDIDFVIETKESLVIAHLFAKSFATNCGVEEISIFPRFGTSMVKVNGMQVEFVIPRKEHYSEDSRKPECELGTLQQDAMRRDFGMNALYLDLDNNEILDLTMHGKDDIEHKIIRVTDFTNPNIIFKEDPLRMLRAIRFACQLEFGIDNNETLKAIRDNVQRIQIISNERIQDELNKILLSKKPSIGFYYLASVGLLKEILPELNATIQVSQPSEYHEKDVFDHIMKVVDNVSPKLELRLAALFHDIGKPLTRTIEFNKIHFYRHEDVGSKMVIDVMKRLRYSNELINKVSFLVNEHMKAHNTNKWTNSAIRRFIKNMAEHLENVLELTEYDMTTSREDRKEKMKKEIDKFKNRIKELKDAVDKAPELLNGNEIMTLFNANPGPWIKKVKEFILNKQMEKIDITKDEVIEILKNTRL